MKAPAIKEVRKVVEVNSFMAHVWLKSGTIAAGDQAVMRPKDIIKVFLINILHYFTFTLKIDKFLYAYPAFKSLFSYATT